MPSEKVMNLTAVDWSIMLVYLVFVLGIGFVLKRHVKAARISFLQADPYPHGFADSPFCPPILGRRK